MFADIHGNPLESARSVFPRPAPGRQPSASHEVGCIYSAQGFEFNRVGVIWGPDLVWRSGKWVSEKKNTKDPGLRPASPAQLNELIRNAYRVLMTRGIHGTRVLCLDEETRDHLIAEWKEMQ